MVVVGGCLPFVDCHKSGRLIFVTIVLYFVKSMPFIAYLMGSWYIAFFMFDYVKIRSYNKQVDLYMCIYMAIGNSLILESLGSIRLKGGPEMIAYSYIPVLQWLVQLLDAIFTN